MGMFDRLVNSKIKSTIKKIIKEKRLVFVSAEEVNYTNKQGVKRKYNLDGMAKILVDASGEASLTQLGITQDDVKDMLVEAYNKQRGGKQ